jgi:hypothetical protein
VPADINGWLVAVAKAKVGPIDSFPEQSLLDNFLVADHLKLADYCDLQTTRLEALVCPRALR